MILKRFLIRVIILVILIALAGLLVVWSFTIESLVFTRLTFILTWTGLIVILVMYVTKTNRTLMLFMESLRYLDRIRVQKGKGKTFEELGRLYNEVLGIIHRIEREKETDRQVFKTIIDHAGTGLMSFDQQGNVEMANVAFKKLLGIRSVRNIEDLSLVTPEIPRILRSTKPGKHKLIRITVNGETIGLWIKMAEVGLPDRKLFLVSVQNIQNELEEEELDAWQKLIRVLTHEIMNSVTPVNSLTNTIIRMFENNGQPRKEIDELSIRNALEGLHSIEKRNKGLISFVQSYRSLTRVQKPVFSDIDIKGLLLRISNLIRQELNLRNIRLVVEMKKEVINLNADEKLLEQVLLNLLHNAIYAVREKSDPEIRMKAYHTNENLLIEVCDNGEGIPAEIIDSIFIPFYTTKPEGSGIGLSLSRQIMRVHGGSISVRTEKEETVFTLKFPV